MKICSDVPSKAAMANMKLYSDEHDKVGTIHKDVFKCSCLVMDSILFHRALHLYIIALCKNSHTI